MGGPVCGESGPQCGRTGGEGAAGQLPLSLPRARNQGVVRRLHTLCVTYRNIIQGSDQVSVQGHEAAIRLTKEVQPLCRKDRMLY